MPRRKYGKLQKVVERPPPDNCSRCRAGKHCPIEGHQGIRKGPVGSGRGQEQSQSAVTRRTLQEGEIQDSHPNPESMTNSSVPDYSGQNLGRIRCVVDVGENSIEIDPYVADFFFEPIFLSGRFPDLTCTAQVLGLDGGEEPLVNVEIVSKRRGQRYDALRITSEEIFSKPNKFSIIFGFDSERLKAPLQLEAEVEVKKRRNSNNC